jgi:hypothetical protein
MPVSLPHVYPAQLVGHAPIARLPSGTWLLVAWTMVMLTVGLFASINLDAGPTDPFQLLANF